MRIVFVAFVSASDAGGGRACADAQPGVDGARHRRGRGADRQGHRRGARGIRARSAEARAQWRTRPHRAACARRRSPKGVDPFAHEDSKGRPAATDMMRDRISPYGAFGENIMYEFHSRGAVQPGELCEDGGRGLARQPGAPREYPVSRFRPQRHRGRDQRRTTAYATQVFMGPPRTAPRPAREPGHGSPGRCSKLLTFRRSAGTRVAAELVPLHWGENLGDAPWPDAKPAATTTTNPSR